MLSAKSSYTLQLYGEFSYFIWLVKFRLEQSKMIIGNFCFHLKFTSHSCIVFYESIANFVREYKLIWKSEWTLVKVSDFRISCFG